MKRSRFLQQAFSPSGLLWLSVLLSLAIALSVEQRVLWDPMAINDDVRNQAYWMSRITDPHLYPNDFIAKYFTQPSLISPAVWGLYALASYWIDPLRFSQFLPFVLIALTTFFLFKFAENKVNARYAFWACWWFNLFIWTVRNFAGGLPRAFFYPLLFLFLWQFVRKNLWGISITLILGGLIYLPMQLLGLGFLLCELCKPQAESGITSRKTLILIMLLCAAIDLLRFWSLRTSHEFGPVTQLSSALGIPELFPGGRIPLFAFPSWSDAFPWNWLQLPLHMLPHWYLLIPAIGLLAVWMLYQQYGKARWGPLDVPAEIGQLLRVSIMFYMLAWLILFYLYVPERYLQFTLPLAIVFVLAAIWHRVDQHGERQATWRARLLLWALPCLLLAFVWQPDIIRPSAENRELFAFLNRTPRQSMIAANPGLSSNIPPLAKRSVLVSHEGYIPFHRDYFRLMKIRLKDWLSAYYATDPEQVSRFLNRYPIDYIVVDANDYEDNRLNLLAKNYYHAFDENFFQQINHGPVPSRYILYRLANKYAVYRSDAYRVVPAQILKTVLSQSNNPL